MSRNAVPDDITARSWCAVKALETAGDTPKEIIDTPRLFPTSPKEIFSQFLASLDFFSIFAVSMYEEARYVASLDSEEEELKEFHANYEESIRKGFCCRRKDNVTLKKITANGS